MSSPSGKKLPGPYEIVNNYGVIIKAITHRKDGMKLKPIEHGTRRGYQRRCFCEACTEANNEYMRIYNSNRNKQRKLF